MGSKLGFAEWNGRPPKVTILAVTFLVAFAMAASALPSYTVLLSKGDGPLPNGSFAGDLLGSPAGTPSDQVFFEIPTTSDGLWRYQAGLFKEIANSTLSIGGLPIWKQQSSGKYFLFEDLAASGHLTILDSVFIGGVNTRSLYYGTGPSFSLIARTGSGAAGIASSTVKTLPFTLPKLSPNGRGAYSALVTIPDSANPGSTKDIGAVWRLEDNVLVAKDDGVAPGTAAATFTNLVNDSAALADNTGRILLLGTLKDGVGDATGSNDEGLWLSDTTGGNLQLVLRKGDAAPGLPGTIQSLHHLGSQLIRNGTPRINSNGKIAFVALVNSTSIGTAVYLGTPGSLTPIFKPTDPAPGLPLETIATIITYYLNDSDQVLLLAGLTHHTPTVAQPSTVDSSNDEVLCLGTPASGGGTDWKLVAREGDSVPDAPGLTIGPLTSAITTQLVSFGPLAQGSIFVSVFSATLEESHAILYFGPSGTLRTTAYEGQMIDINGTPTLLTLLDHTERALAGSGHVVFRAFLGGSTVGSGSTNQAKILAASFTGTPFPPPLPFTGGSPTPTPPPGGPTPVPASPPTITVAKKFAGKNGKAIVKGTVSAGVVKVEIKIGKGKPKAAKLAGPSWKFKAKGLKKGSYSVTITATTAGGLSATRKTKIVEK